MEINLTTFILEIVNFLILVWLLRRFLYNPVMGVIERRQRRIAETVATAEAKQQEAAQTEAQCKRRLAELEQEREAAREALAQEINAERERLTQAMRAEVEQEREKARFLSRKQEAEAERRQQEAAMGQGVRFATRLLSRLASPELEARLVELTLQDLRALPEGRIEALRCAYREGEVSGVEITSAYPLDERQRGALVEVLEMLLQHAVPACRFQEDRALIAGLRINIGPWVLHANLHDELGFFAEAGHGGT